MLVKGTVGWTSVTKRLMLAIKVQTNIKRIMKAVPLGIIHIYDIYEVKYSVVLVQLQDHCFGIIINANFCFGQ